MDVVGTEYCTSRTEPDLLRSSYLQTIGRLLNKNIDFLWTGNTLSLFILLLSSIAGVRFTENLRMNLRKT